MALLKYSSILKTDENGKQIRMRDMSREPVSTLSKKEKMIILKKK